MLDIRCYDHIRKRALEGGQGTGWPVLAEWIQGLKTSLLQALPPSNRMERLETPKVPEGLQHR